MPHHHYADDNSTDGDGDGNDDDGDDGGDDGGEADAAGAGRFLPNIGYLRSIPHSEQSPQWHRIARICQRRGITG